MTKVYTLGIQNFDALDGFMTSTDIKLFFDKEACKKWMDQEIKNQAKKGFKLKQYGNPEYWEFIKETLHGNYKHVFYGQYREVINEADL